jgi:hypothetical protein
MSLFTDIVNILRSPECKRINFQIAGIRVYGDGYKTIAKTIENKHIQIIRSLVLPSSWAVYNRKLNYLAVGQSPRPNLIVHECTHALNDWHKRNILAIDDEVSAHIAQMMYMIIKKPALNNFIAQLHQKQGSDVLAKRCEIDKNFCSKATFMAALVIAGDFLNCRKPSIDRLMKLRNSLQRDPTYIKNASNRTRAYDGILRKTIPAAELRKIRGTVINR